MEKLTKQANEVATQPSESGEVPSLGKAKHLAFGKMMEEAKTGIFVRRETIMEALKVKE